MMDLMRSSVVISIISPGGLAVAAPAAPALPPKISSNCFLTIAGFGVIETEYLSDLSADNCLLTSSKRFL
jgi:hypothetical protein